MNPQDQQNLQNDPAQADLNPNPQGLDPNDPNVARDPVCGMLIVKSSAQNTMAAPVNEPMETIYFCSADCKAIFEQDPERFGYNL